MSATKILFLDIDGVLNSLQFLKTHRPPGQSVLDSARARIDPKALTRLYRIIAATGCQVVISSTWRKLHPLERLETILGIKILGVTPIGTDRREEEIQAFLKHHPNAVYVAVDDDSDIDTNLVKTDFEEGLQDSHVDEIIRRLNSPPM